MERRYRPGALKQRREVAGERTRSRSRNQRGMVEAAIPEACRVCWNRYERCVTTELALHGTDRTL